VVRAVLCVLRGMQEEEGHLQLRVRLGQREEDVADNAWFTDLHLRKKSKEGVKEIVQVKLVFKRKKTYLKNNTTIK